MKCKEVLVVFMHQDSPDAERSFINWAISKVTGCNIVHCELYFAQDGLACSADCDGVKFRRERSFEREGWEFMSLRVTPTTYDRMMEFCRRAEGNDFDYWGMMGSVACIPSSMATPGSWHCSMLVSAALVDSGLFGESVDPFSVTPKGIRDELLRMDVACNTRNPWKVSTEPQ